MGFYPLSLTCTVDGLDHLVSDEAAAAGITAGQGTCMALCGHTVHIAPLVCSAGRPCPHCALHMGLLHHRPSRRAHHNRPKRLFGHQSTWSTRRTLRDGDHHDQPSKPISEQIPVNTPQTGVTKTDALSLPTTSSPPERADTREPDPRQQRRPDLEHKFIVSGTVDITPASPQRTRSHTAGWIRALRTIPTSTSQLPNP